MADFAITVTAAEPALGWDPGSFLDLFTDTRRAAVEGLFEGDVVVAALQKLAPYWSGTAADLRRRLTLGLGLTDTELFPKTAKATGNKLRELAPGLRQVGIDVSFHKGHDRTIEIRRAGTGTAAAIVADSGEAGQHCA